MRLTRTFVLRLYADRGARERLCGDLLAPPARRTHPFKDGAELLGLLQRLALDEPGDVAHRGPAHRVSGPDPPRPDAPTDWRP